MACNYRHNGLISWRLPLVPAPLPGGPLPGGSAARRVSRPDRRPATDMSHTPG